MLFHRHTAHLLTLAALLTATSGLAAPAPAREKTTWNYDGGIFLETDGSLSGGICFRVSGRVTAPDFFDNLRRIDKPGIDAIFRRGKDTVTEYPARLFLQFVIHDLPCSLNLHYTGSRTYLTRAMVSELRLSLYWKRGVDLRALTDYTPVAFSVRSVLPFNPDAGDLPVKLEWEYEFAVPSAGVPLTDSLILIIRTPDQQVAARGAARM